jgi:anti-anti-sigma factor
LDRFEGTNRRVETDEDLLTVEGDGPFVLAGELDLASVDRLRAALAPSIERGDDIILDCEGLEFLGSEGLRVLIEVAGALEGRGTLVIRKASGISKQVIDLAGIQRVANLVLEDGP